jgi:hypothetical protein
LATAQIGNVPGGSCFDAMSITLIIAATTGNIFANATFYPGEAMFTALRKLWSHRGRRGDTDRHRFRHIPAPVAPGYAIKSVSDPFRPRKGSEEDGGASLYQRHGLLEPPYPFADCWVDYEQSDVLTSCIDAILRNCERPHDLEFVSDLTEK